MADFINDPEHYGSIAAYDKAKASYVVWIMKQREEELQRVGSEFTESDFHEFKEQLQGARIVPSSVVSPLNMEERTALYNTPTVEARNAIRKDYVAKRVKRTREWLENEYGARSTFLEPLDEKEMRMLSAKLKSTDAKRLAQGDKESLVEGCIVWRGGKNNGKPCMERRGRREGPRGGPTKRRRCIGSTADMLYNYWIRPLLPGERLKRTCSEPMCVNPYHYKLK